jgi:hypothetical protein
MYAMLAANLVKDFSGGAGASVCHILQTLTDTLFGVRSGGDVQQALVGFRVLDNGGGFSVHRKHHRAFGLPELFHKVTG